MANLSNKQIQDLAKQLENAELHAHKVNKLTDDYPDISYQNAFDIQWEIRRLKESKGHRVVGMKMGVTSVASMARLGVTSPCYGFLVDYFSIPNGGDIQHDELINPHIEAELAFVTKAPLQGPGIHIGDVLQATDFVMPVIGVVDSRYKESNVDIKSVIADNASSSRFVAGGTMARPEDLDLKNLGVVMEVNGEVVQLGAGAAVLGHPASSVAILANMLSERGEQIPAGTFIMVGAITLAVAVKKGDSFTARYQGLGTVSGRFV
jgi:2-oxo-3-hexenedioate decarboxylase